MQKEQICAAHTRITVPRERKNKNKTKKQKRDQDLCWYTRRGECGKEGDGVKEVHCDLERAGSDTERDGERQGKRERREAMATDREASRHTNKLGLE